MPWDIFRQVSFANLRMVCPESHALDSELLEVTELDPKRFRDVKSDEATLPLQELLEWIAKHPFTGYKGGIARLVAKILWLERGNPDLESEIQGFNDIDLICFLQDGEEQQKAEMKELVDAGLSIGGIPVEAQDVEYSYDTIPHVLATRDLTQNQKVYTELLRLGFVDHQQFPHVLWGECYAYVNSLISRHGYRLELESDFDSAAVEKWKEAKYAEQLARTRISIFRDFRFHRMVLDETFLMPYVIADTPLTAGLKGHTDAGQLEHPSREHLTRLRRLQSRTAIAAEGGSLTSSTARSWADDQHDPLLNQNMFGKLTMTETFLHLCRIAKIAWPRFLASFLVNGFAAVLFVLVINHVAPGQMEKEVQNVSGLDQDPGTLIEYEEVKRKGCQSKLVMYCFNMF
eukprot:g13278.t1